MKIVIACSKNWFALDRSLMQEHEIVFIADPAELSVERLSELGPRYVFFPHWNWIVKKEIFEKFECIVFHTAPLPYGRGGTPIQNLIVEGATQSPVCALRMTSVVDGGPIYAKQTIALNGSLAEIFARLNVAVNALIRMIVREQPEPKEQTGAVHEFRRRTPEDNEIPAKLALDGVYDRIRMLDAEDYPNAFMRFGGYRIEFEAARLEDGEIVCTARISIDEKDY